MKKNYIFSFVFMGLIQVAHSFEISAYEKKIKTNYNLTSVTEKISKDSLEKNLRDFLNSSRPSRYVGSPGHQLAMDYIEAKLKSFHSQGSRFEKSEFTPEIIKGPASLKNLKGYNFSWEKKGVVKPDEVIILGANYDTILKDIQSKADLSLRPMPGADNNGTGVAALLSMIEILDKLDLPKTVRIVFFDFDQLELLGSKNYAEKLIKKEKGAEKIVGFINLVMLGNDSKRGDVEKKFNNMKVYLRPLTAKGGEEDFKLMTLMTENGKRLYKGIEFSPLANGMSLSSQQSFWDAGIPAICFSQNWESDLNPRINTANDFVETLNMATYVSAFRYITGALLAWNYDIVK